MRKLPLIIFFFITITAFCSSTYNYLGTERKVEGDVNKALALTLVEMPSDVVSADTIRCYRSHLTISELKETAYLAMKTVRKGDRQVTEMVAEANCGFLTIFMLSDQRASGILLLVGILWMIGSTWYLRKYRPELFAQGLNYGGIVYADDRFMTVGGEPIHLTPMQHSLLKMFMNAKGHSLAKQEICDHLWPGKPDASDTLYTLIKRIKPILETHSNLKIESDRSKNYRLEHK